jgi:hypothetical protein
MDAVTKENLLKKHCLDSDTCAICNSGVESSAHLIAGCSFSVGFWARIGVELDEDDVATLWQVRPPVHLPPAHFNAFLLLCCWRLWKHRHDVVFRSLPPAMIGSSRDVAKMPNSGHVDCPLRTVMLPLHGLLFSLPPPLLSYL